MQGPPGGGGWNPGGGAPPGGAWPPQQGSQPGTQQPSAPGAPARTVALSQAELMSVHGQTPSPAQPGTPAAPPPGVYPGAMPAQPVALAQPVPTNVGVWIGILFSLVGVFSCLATAAAAALLGEGDAMMVSYLTVPLIPAGLFAPIVGGIARSQSQPVAIGAPIGCGCVTMLFTLVATVVFYQAIWPSL